MSVREQVLGTLDSLRGSALLKGAISLVWALLFIGGVLILLLLLTFLLRQFFRAHEGIKKTQRILIYLLTMAGVLILTIGGLLGIILPVIPGFLLLLIALLLLRRYHKHPWIENKILYLRWRLRLREQYGKVKKRMRSRTAKVRRGIREKKSKLGKALRMKRGSGK